jgi:hypothetical protein
MADADAVVATIIAAIIAASVATFGYVITARAKLLEQRRRTYAAALAAVEAYKQLPYRIRRRPDDSSATRGALGTAISDIQRDLDFYRRLLDLDSPKLGNAYYALVQASRDQGKQHRDEAWKQPPANKDEAMSFPERYSYGDLDHELDCLKQMRRHLRLIPVRWHRE